MWQGVTQITTRLNKNIYLLIERNETIIAMGNIGETAKNKFLLPLQQNDASSVYNSFHPELKGEFELQLFRQFVRALNEGLGTFDKVSPQHIEKGVAYSSALGKTKSQ